MRRRLTTHRAADYRETAAKLQKEWRVHQPHRQFDFASHVNTYALVSLLNKGLVYEDYQRQFAAAKKVRNLWGCFSLALIFPRRFSGGCPPFLLGLHPAWNWRMCAGGGLGAQGRR